MIDAQPLDVFVVLHNLVTDAVRTPEVKRYLCADDAYRHLPVDLGGGVERPNVLLCPMGYDSGHRAAPAPGLPRTN